MPADHETNVSACLALAFFLVVLGLGPGLAQSEGDPKQGAAAFKMQCVTCHVIRTPSGELIAGQNGRVSPNLYGVVGKIVAQQAGVPYSRFLRMAGEAELTWSVDNFTAYVRDPTERLRDVLQEPRARSPTALRVRDPGDALDIFAYLALFSDATAGAVLAE